MVSSFDRTVRKCNGKQRLTKSAAVSAPALSFQFGEIVKSGVPAEESA
jgi:hypothetical protein